MSALTSWDQGSGRFPRLGGLGMEAGGWVGEWLGEVGAVSGFRSSEVCGCLLFVESSARQSWGCCQNQAQYKGRRPVMGNKAAVGA